LTQPGYLEWCYRESNDYPVTKVPAKWGKTKYKRKEFWGERGLIIGSDGEGGGHT